MQTASRLWWLRWLAAGSAAACCVVLTACGGGSAEAERAVPQAAEEPARVRTLAASSNRPAPPDTAALLDWAQTRYPTLFEAGPSVATGDYEGQRYDYRYYPRTNSYLGVRDGEVFGLGPFTNQQLTSFGPVAGYSCEVYPTVCAGDTLGSLALSGPGLVAAGGKNSFLPAAAATVRETAAVCDTASVKDAQAQQALCTSTLRIEWAASAAVRLVVVLRASYPAPGVPPGYGVNGIDLEYAVFGAPGASLACSTKVAGDGSCDLAALGIRLNPIVRALSFTDTPLNVVGGARLVLNGTLTY